MRPADSRTIVAGSTTRHVAIMRVISSAVGGVALGRRSLPPTTRAVPSPSGVPGDAMQCSDMRNKISEE